MLAAYHLAKQCLPEYRNKFSRHDFTLPQLFACLALKEHQRQTYRGIEALLADAPHWCREIGMNKVPDHNTLCRAFHALNLGHRSRTFLDRLGEWAVLGRLLGSTVAIDSSHFDTHHRSRHYERRCRHYASNDRRTADAARRRSARRTPKLGIAVNTRTHVILSAIAKSGMGSDCPDFEPLLREALGRVPKRRLKTVLGDAGYDSESNHCLARNELGLRSYIKPSAGRPSQMAPAGRYRRLMRKRLAGSQKGRPYGQRAQVETVNSMLKRNLGDSLRARSPRARRHEQLLRVIVHNLMIFRRTCRGSRQSRCVPVPFPLSLDIVLIQPLMPFLLLIPPSIQRACRIVIRDLR